MANKQKELDEEVFDQAEDVKKWMTGMALTKLTEALSRTIRREHLANLLYSMSATSTYGYHSPDKEEWDRAHTILMTRLYRAEAEAWHEFYVMALGDVTDEIREIARRAAYNRIFYQGYNKIRMSLAHYPRVLRQSVLRYIDPDGTLPPIVQRLTEDQVGELMGRGFRIDSLEHDSPAFMIEKMDYPAVYDSGESPVKTDVDLIVSDNQGRTMVHVTLEAANAESRTKWVLERCVRAVYEELHQKPPEDLDTLDPDIEDEWGPK